MGTRHDWQADGLPQTGVLSLEEGCGAGTGGCGCIQVIREVGGGHHSQQLRRGKLELIRPRGFDQ